MAARYAQIAEDLRERIAAGEYAPGAHLPSEPELGEAYGVSRITIRSAFDALRDEGVLTSARGKGVVVAPPKRITRVNSQERLSRARRRANAAAFLAEADRYGFRATSSVKVRFEVAGDAYAAVLGIDPDEAVCVRDRVLRADGEPVQLATSRLPRAVTRDTALETADTGAGGAYARLDESVGLTRFAESVGGRTATSRERSALSTTVVLHVRRLAYSGARVVECNDMIMSAERYELEYSWAAD